MKILFFGWKGWIGNMIVECWKNSYPNDELILSETRVNETNKEQLEKEISQVDCVFSTIGRTSGFENGKLIPNIDYLETHLYENVRDNLSSPMLLAIICDKLKVHYSYLGTGCIFTRNTRNNDYEYVEEDEADYFGSAYSVVKGFTDGLIKMYPQHLNFRIRMPITDDLNPKNFITKISKFSKICNYPNSMTYLPDMIPYMIEMSRDKIRGTYNMVNTNPISHSEILELYKEIVDNTHEYECIEEDELNKMLKSKRSNNVLRNDKLRKIFLIRPIKECVAEAMHKISKNSI